MSSPRTRIPVLVGLALAFVARVGGATDVFDHLACSKVKDPAGRAAYSVDLLPHVAPFPPESGCVVRVPAKLLCVSTVKSNVTPVPPGGPAGLPLPAELLVCYKLKCPKATLSVPVTDQFGSRTLTAKAPSIICAPANVPVPCGSAQAPECNGTCDFPGANCGSNGQGGCVCAFG